MNEFNKNRLLFLLYKKSKGRTTGLEPANDGITTHCLNHLATIAFRQYYTVKKIYCNNINFKKFKNRPSRNRTYIKNLEGLCPIH